LSHSASFESCDKDAPSKSGTKQLEIGEALQIGRTEAMATEHTNEPRGGRYEKAMAKWLIANGFKEIDKATRKRLFDCLKHRPEIEKWRATLTEGERFKFNHPDAVLRRWQKATVVPDPNAPEKPLSPMAKLKQINLELQEELHRAKREISRGGGDLWDKDDRPDDIAAIMLAKLSAAKAERVARAILAKLKEKKSNANIAPKPIMQSAEIPVETIKAEFVTLEQETTAP
jgi:hypothetical protein